MVIQADTIFCDDVRQETGGKMSYMGIYRGGMSVKDLPTTLPKLCMAVRVSVSSEEPQDEVTGRILYQDDVLFEWVLPRLEPDLSPDINSSYRATIYHLQLAPFVIDKEGYLRVRLYAGDTEYKAGALRIELAGGGDKSQTEASIIA